METTAPPPPPPPAPVPPPVPPLSPTTMDSLVRVDLTTLHSDAVLVYANRIAQLQATRTNSPEKLQMLFVLAQKLVRWFMDERREMERLNNALEETLLEALATCAIPPRSSIQDAENDPGSEDAQTQSDEVTTNAAPSSEVPMLTPAEMVDCGVQVGDDLAAENAPTEAGPVLIEADPVPLCSTVETQTELAVECVDGTTQVEATGTTTTDGCVQTDTSALESANTEVQTEMPPACVDSSVQAEAMTSEESAQTDAVVTEHLVAETQTDVACAGVDCSVQVQALVDDGSAQTDTVAEPIIAETQTDAATVGVECSVQVEPVICEGSAQTNPGAEQSTTDTQTDCAKPAVDCSVQVEAITAEGIAQTDGNADTCVAETQTIGTDAVECGVQIQAATAESTAQTNPCTELVESSTQDQTTMSEALTQTELAASVAECEVQADIRTPTTEESAQTEFVVQSADCTVQTELETGTMGVQTPVLEVTDSEMQTTTVTADHETSTREDFDSADFSVQATETDWIVITPSVDTTVTAPLDVYFQVHRSIVRLQRIVRGFMTRRRFYRMLNELVNAK